MTYEASEFDALFTVPVLYERCTGTSDGERSYEPAKTVMSRIDALGGRTTHAFQDNVPLRTLLMKAVATDGSPVAPTAADRITLPAGYPPPLQPAIRASNPVHDETGVHHFEVLI